MTALDVGCGNGRNSVALAALGFANVVAVDPVEELLLATAQMAHAADVSISTRRAALPTLPCDTNAAGLVVCWGLIFDLGGPQATRAAMREFARVLHPAGYLVADWHTCADSLRTFAVEKVAPQTYRLREDAPAGLGGLVYSFWDADAVRSFHAEAGFEIEALHRLEISDLLDGLSHSWWQTCARRREAGGAQAGS